MSLEPCRPIVTAPLFPELLSGLLELLHGLRDDAWQKPTACSGWSVKDVALHLLGGEAGILSRRRDAFTPGDVSIESWEQLVRLIDGLNRTWLEATRRLSPPVLVDLLQLLGRQTCEYFSALSDNPDAPGDIVAWASDAPAPVWLELAREYSERWHHQQQIRDAIGMPGFAEARYLAPALDAFARGLPRSFASVEAPPGTLVTLLAEGDGGGCWTLRREDETWRLYAGSPQDATATLALSAQVAWRVFCKGVSPGDAEQAARIDGDVALAHRVLKTISIIG
jgi:uncharacterized protein (TIGR03083 family)